jgi:hypothetical protein
MENKNSITFIRVLGTDKNGYTYLEGSDRYVYQFDGPKYLGWFCSLPAWERTMHKILD